MIPERIAHIEETLRTAPNIPDSTRGELIALLAGLKAEIVPLATTHGDSIEQITGHADAAITAATQPGKPPGEAAQAVEGLATSVRDFEASHPRLVEIVDRLAVILSNTGI
jgi:hypothetical protein